MKTTTPIGIYLHIPFCGKKCPYCDFYSAAPAKSVLEEYTAALEQKIASYQNKGIFADTLYFGGGTPNLLGGERIARLIRTAKESFGLPDNSEITVEANPFTATAEFYQTIAEAGANRLSLGLQSANDNELKRLGRRHTAEQAAQSIQEAKTAGFQNISLDLMLAIPGQTKESLLHSIEFCAAQDIQHISAYLLKIEPGTSFYDQQDTLNLPDEDTVSEFYRFTVEELAKRGFAQYEISNFARNGLIGKHNTKYWHCEEYLGLGPSAHSYFNGKRFYYPPSLQDFLAGKAPIYDGDGGSREEFAMLQLRLTEGLSDTMWQSRFHEPIPSSLLRAAKKFEKPGLIAFDSEKHFHITSEGFLVSNLLIGELIDAIE